MSLLTDNSMLLTQKSLDYLWKKQTVILDNIANSETPNYKSKYVTFEDEIKLRLSSAKNKKNSNIRNEILDTNINIHTTNNESMRMDGNNVDTAVENVELARSTLQYEYLLRSINDDFTRLRTAIRGQ